jgi:PAS domain S-box-containing protein
VLRIPFPWAQRRHPRRHDLDAAGPEPLAFWRDDGHEGSDGYQGSDEQCRERESKEAADRYNFLADTVPLILWTARPDGGLDYYNKAWFDYTGLTLKETEDWGWRAVIHPDDLQMCIDRWTHSFTSGIDYEIEYRFKRGADGTYRWFLGRASARRDARGAIVQWVGTGTDIDDQKRAQGELRRVQAELENRVLTRTAELADSNHALQRQQTELRVLFDLMPAMVWFKNTDNDILRVNERVAEAAGKSIAEIEGKPSLEIYPEDAARFYADDLEVIRSGVPKLGYVETIQGRNGQERWVQTDKVPYRDKDGKVIGIVVMAQDVTDRRRTADALRMSTEEISRTNLALQAEIVERTRAEASAAAANRAKSEFLANMSHEIRTPLNGIVGMTELVLGTELSAEQHEYLAVIKTSGESLLTVINDILDFSKIEAGELAFDVIPFNLEACVSTALKLLATRAHLKGLELAMDVRPGVPTALVGDCNRLSQVIANLVANAIKFTSHGEVLLTVEAETHTARRAILRFSVADTGIGVPVERQAAIFRPFVQADGSTTRDYGGTGLGLAISTKLVALLGGRLWLESEAGKGSTFFFTAYFDLQQLPAPGTIDPDPRMVRLVDMPVLVVDDNALSRRLLAATLGQWRMKPVLAGSGRAGMAAMQARKSTGTAFPLVLLDAEMPDMDGLSVAEAIRNDPGLAGAAILMRTTTGHRRAGDRSRASGIAAFLVKPISQPDLLEAVFSALGMPSDGIPRQPAPARHAVPDAPRALRILLAEDNKVNQLVATSLLRKRGHTVSVAATGREALAALDEAGPGAFDVVLMDVQMPDMDGFEATRIIRAREQSTGVHLPIVAMTANAMKGDKERCLAAGMDGYVAKPFDTDEFFAAISSVLA